MTVFDHIVEYLDKAAPHKIQRTSSPNILCTKVEPHWRSNKSLPYPFTVILLTPVKDGTKVTVAVGNEDTPCGDIRNETAKFQRQIAKFNDLRFVGKSGRGKNFHITITVHSKPLMVAVVPQAIKVTVDGPRDARTSKPCDQKRKRGIDITAYQPLYGTSPMIPTYIYPCLTFNALTPPPTIPQVSVDYSPAVPVKKPSHPNYCGPRKKHTESVQIWRPFEN
ncbi:unnamed protein product [Auanema sp. JU1783]|nr:unnamed protein product [Auanema sp. JU1783]